MDVNVTPVVGPDRASAAQGLILGIDASAALPSNPSFGRLSDSTMSRWGQRPPSIVGSIGLAVCVFAIAIANVLTLIVAWFVARLAANACLAAYLVTLAISGALYLKGNRHVDGSLCTERHASRPEGPVVRGPRAD
jgi:MFS family permease